MLVSLYHVPESNAEFPPVARMRSHFLCEALCVNATLTHGAATIDAYPRNTILLNLIIDTMAQHDAGRLGWVASSIKMSIHRLEVVSIWGWKNIIIILPPQKKLPITPNMWSKTVLFPILTRARMLVYLPAQLKTKHTASVTGIAGPQEHNVHKATLVWHGNKTRQLSNRCVPGNADRSIPLQETNGCGNRWIMGYQL